MILSRCYYKTSLCVTYLEHNNNLWILLTICSIFAIHPFCFWLNIGSYGFLFIRSSEFGLWTQLTNKMSRFWRMLRPEPGLFFNKIVFDFLGTVRCKTFAASTEFVPQQRRELFVWVLVHVSEVIEAGPAMMTQRLSR